MAKLVCYGTRTVARELGAIHDAARREAEVFVESKSDPVSERIFTFDLRFGSVTAAEVFVVLSGAVPGPRNSIVMVRKA